MDRAKIKEFLEAKPFRPFTMVLPSDREITVPHPEFMAVSPFGYDAIVWDRRGADKLIDLRWVVELKPARRRAAKR